MNPLFFFSESPGFRPKSAWKPSLGHSNFEAFLSQLEKEVFTVSQKPLRYLNLSKEEWQTVRSLSTDRNIVIKKADKGSGVVIWDCLDYIMESEKQLYDKTIYADDTFNKNIIPNLTGKSNKISGNLKRIGYINEKQLKYFRFKFKKSCNM